MYPGVFLVFIWPGVHWTSWICNLIVSPRFGEVLPLFLQIFFCPIISLLYFHNSSYVCVRPLDVVCQITEAVLFFSLFFSSANSYWSVFKYSDSSIGYNLFKNPFSMIFISDIVLFSSGISIWFFAKIPHLFTQKDNWRTLFYSPLSSFIPFAPMGHPLGRRYAYWPSGKVTSKSISGRPWKQCCACLGNSVCSSWVVSLALWILLPMGCREARGGLE